MYLSLMKILHLAFKHFIYLEKVLERLIQDFKTDLMVSEQIYRNLLCDERDDA